MLNDFEQTMAFEPREWEAFSDQACGGDEGMRREAAALSTVHERPGGFAAAPGAIMAERLPAEGTVLAGLVAGRLRVGTVVDGRYRIDGALGVGGMGAVYRATHLQLERAVALKGVRSDLLAIPATAERFRREAVAAARLRHPHIVTVYDYGVAPDVGAYLVMELLEGHSLRHEFVGRGRPELSTALGLMAQMCAAVGAAHEAGVIHRDLKPENIFLETRARAIKVVDFGLAKLEAAFTFAGEAPRSGEGMLGTPGYMSPEQCRGEEADARSDIYALGCVMYEMLTGRRPFESRSVWSLVSQHVNRAPRRPSELVPGLGPRVEAAVLRALAKAPEDRHQSAEAFAEALGAPGEVGTMPPAEATPATAGALST